MTFPQILNAAFNQIRQHARSSVAVTLRLLEAATALAGRVSRSEDRSALALQVEMIFRGAMESLPEEWDRREVEACYLEAVQALSMR